MKGVKAKGWGSCYQTRDKGGWGFVTMSIKLALQVTNMGLLFLAKVFLSLGTVVYL